MNIIAKNLKGGKSLTYLLAGVFALFVGSTWAEEYHYWTGVGADALDHLTIDIAPDVLDGRKYSIAVTDDGKIVLNIKPDGFLMIVR